MDSSPKEQSKAVQATDQFPSDYSKPVLRARLLIMVIIVLFDEYTAKISHAVREHMPKATGWSESGLNEDDRGNESSEE